MKIVKFSLLVKGIGEAIKNEANEQNGGFLGMLFGALADSVLGSALAGKPKIPGREVIGVGEGTTRAGQDF